MKYYIGIDPGLDGAVAVLDEKGEIVLCEDTPTITIKSGGKNRRRYQPNQMVFILRTALRRIDKTVDLISGVKDSDMPEVTIVGLEYVRAMPGQGVSSMFTMGMGVGLWEGIIATLGLPMEQVTPVVWKRVILGGATGDANRKETSRLKAQQLFPTQTANLLTRKKDHGRAEALLIAEYFRRKRGFEGVRRSRRPRSPTQRPGMQPRS